MTAATDTATRRSTREAILDAAERLFAECGYNGVSVREIAAAAEVMLGSVTYHFPSKAALLKEVFLRRVTPIQEERRARIEAVVEAARGGVPDLHAVLAAFLEPAFRQSRANESYRRLAGRVATDPSPEVRRVMAEIYNRETMILPKVLRLAVPHLSDDELYWRYYCLHGAVQYVQADVGKIQAVAGEDFDSSDPERAMRFVIPFLVAGLTAPGIDPAAAPPPVERASGCEPEDLP